LKRLNFVFAYSGNYLCDIDIGALGAITDVKEEWLEKLEKDCLLLTFFAIHEVRLLEDVCDL
jgi:hypothetical protein